MQWRQFVMNLGSLSPDGVEAIFSRHGACAVTLSDAADDPVLEPEPGEVSLWPDSRITGLFPVNADFQLLERELLEVFGLSDLPVHFIEDLADRPWEREWLESFQPMCFGNRLWVSPEAFDVDADDATVLRLDPGLAFGTGTHPTTALCLKWLDGIELSGKSMLDYGCGSGILAIAALLLGAESAHALDIDPQALAATVENARKNAVENRLIVTQDLAEQSGSFDIVVANILAEPLIRDAREISDRLGPGGQLALSGILAHQADAVMAAYRDWIDFEPGATDATTNQTWVRLNGRRI